MKRRIWLVICGTDPQQGAIEIEDGRYVIGRGTECEIHLPHREVSRHHAEIVRENGRMAIRDLDSRNGTFVDGKRVRSVKIDAGSSIRVAHVVFDVLDRLDRRSAAEMDDDDTDPAPVTHAGDAALRAVRFSPARRQVFELLLSGYAEKQIACQLDLTDHQIHRHVKRIYKAMGVHSRAELCACVHATIDSPVEMMAGI